MLVEFFASKASKLERTDVSLAAPNPHSKEITRERVYRPLTPQAKSLLTPDNSHKVSECET